MIRKKKEVNNFERSSLQYCKEISEFKPLSKEEELELFKDYKYNHSLDARNKLVNANLKFVMNIAKSYYGQGLSYADLISEGNMGLMKAIDEKFDESKDCKIITYSVWWIKQMIQDAIKKRNGIEHDDLPIDTEPRSLMDDEDTQIVIGDEFSDKS
jgi:RNA polymerase primary sigma factor